MTPEVALAVGTFGGLVRHGRYHRKITLDKTELVAKVNENLLFASLMPGLASRTDKVAVFDDGDRRRGRIKSGFVSTDSCTGGPGCRGVCVRSCQKQTAGKHYNDQADDGAVIEPRSVAAWPSAFSLATLLFLPGHISFPQTTTFSGLSLW